jgi:hypothetical protein
VHENSETDPKLLL